MNARPPVSWTASCGDLRREIALQYDVVWRERVSRMPLTLAAYALVAIYLPVWLAALGAVVNVATDAAGMVLMRDLDPLVQRGRYRAIWALHFVMQACYAAVAALIWQRGANFSDAFAMGMAMTTLLHVSTVRAIHLPFGLAALAGTAIPVLAGNAWRWAPGGQWSILVLSTTCALVGLAYVLAAMVMTNRLYRDAAVGRAAAQAGFEAKNRFLAQMSHELRTPLNAILGMGHAELRRNRDELSRERLSVLISAAEGLSTILDDVLDMAAVQEGRIPLRPTTAIPLEEIRSTVALFRPGVEAAGLALGLDLAGGLSRPARFDAQRLRQCLSNLLSNALKNTVAGRIDVTARIEGRAGQGAVLVLCVADTGPGIPAHLRERIFEPFRPNRAEAQGRIAAMPGSNGLGLSISQALARQMGGDLVLGEADGGPGARFVLTLALGAPDAGGAGEGGADVGRKVEASWPSVPLAAAHLAPQDAAARQAGSGLAGLRVLVVDDIATNRLVAVTYLRHLGAQPIVAAGGGAALARMRTEAVDLVLLDLNMPDMDGMETLRAIRALPAPAGAVPVIAMTADTGPGQREAYVREGLDGYLAKPISPDRIEAEIAAARRHRTAMAGETARPVVVGGHDGRE